MSIKEFEARYNEEWSKKKPALLRRFFYNSKQIDYFEKVKRLIEIPLIEKSRNEKQVFDKNYWEVEENKRVQLTIQFLKSAKENRIRLNRMHPEFSVFLEKLKEHRTAEYKVQILIVRLRFFHVHFYPTRVGSAYHILTLHIYLM